MSSKTNRPETAERDSGPSGETYGRGGGIGQFVLVAIVTVLLLAGVIYSAFQLGSRGSDDTPRLVRAEETPVRVAPEDPGGLVIADTDRQIYETVDGTRPGEGVAATPATERPAAPLTARAQVDDGTDREIRAEITDLTAIPPRVILSDEPDPAPDGPPDRTLDEVAASPITGLTDEDTQEIGPSYEALTAGTGADPDDSVSTAAVAGTDVAGAATESTEPESTRRTAEQIIAAVARAPLPTVNPRRPDGFPPPPPRLEEPPAATTVLGSSVIGAVAPSAAPQAPATPAFEVQLAALGSPAEAEARWQRVAPTAPDLFSQVQGYRVVRSPDGVWYRLRVGPFQTRADANGFCSALKGRNISCYVPPSGG